MPSPKPELNIRESRKAVSPRSSQEHAVSGFFADYKGRERSSSGSALKDLIGRSATSALATLENYSDSEVIRPSKSPKKRNMP